MYLVIGRMELDDFYDLIIVGTGLTESILSCAAARSGKKVLHLDSNEFYGSQQTAFTLSSFLSSFHCGLEPSFLPKSFIVHSYPHMTAADVEVKTNAKLSTCQGLPDEIETLLKKDRYYNIDLNPQMLLGAGQLVETLIESGASKYLEFKSCDQVLFFDEKDCHFEEGCGKAWKIPFSRNDIFSSSHLSIFDKRTLMKFQQFVSDFNQTQSGNSVKCLNELDLARGRSLHRPQNKTDSVFDVRQKNLSDVFEYFNLTTSLQSVILYAVCQQFDTGIVLQSCEPMLKRVAIFASSLARFGNSAFLAPLYGISEIIQGFCRMSSVWGTTFVLRRGISRLDYSDAQNIVVTDALGQKVSCSAAVVNVAYVPTGEVVLLQPKFTLQTKILSKKKFFSAERSVSVIPPHFRNSKVDLSNSYAVFVTESDHSTCAVPEGMFSLHIQTLVDDLSSTSSIHSQDWISRASANSSFAKDLVDRIILLLQSQCSEPIDILCKTIFFTPKYEQLRPQHSNIRFCGLESQSEYSLDTYASEAANIWKELFGDTKMFESTAHQAFAETDDEADNQDEEEYKNILGSLSQNT